MNLTPTEVERLTIFTAAEIARRNRAAGVRLSHPEAIALITDEMMLAARRDLPYEEVVDLAGSLLTFEDVEPGVPAMIPVICVEGQFSQGTKMIVVFAPIAPAPGDVVPGEVVPAADTIEINRGKPVVELEVVNTGDRDIQVRSHAHFFEVNPQLSFDRARSFGLHLDVPSGGGERFQPGIPTTVRLVPFGGTRRLSGFAGLVDGHLDDPAVRDVALAAARSRGYLGA